MGKAKFLCGSRQQDEVGTTTAWNCAATVFISRLAGAHVTLVAYTSIQTLWVGKGICRCCAKRENIHDKAQRNQIVGWVHCVTFSCVLLRLDEQWRHKQGIFSRRTQRTMPVNMGCECVCLRILSTYVHIYQYTVLANSNQRSIFLKKFLDSRPNSLT